jgi:hypothetical protein
MSQALRSRLTLAAFERKSPRQALAALTNSGVKELELIVVGGEPVYLAMLRPGDTRVVPVDGQPAPGFDTEQIIGLVRNAAGSEVLASIDKVDHYDRYYLDRHGERPLPAIVVRFSDIDHTRYYIDPRTARIVGSYSSSRWISRWLYHALHSLDFPWLYNHRPLWDIVVITFMLGGTGLAVTALILAWRVVGRKLNPIAAGPLAEGDASEDLIAAPPRL